MLPQILRSLAPALRETPMALGLSSRRVAVILGASQGTAGSMLRMTGVEPDPLSTWIPITWVWKFTPATSAQ